MKIGIGLPNPVPNTEGHVLLDWAKRAEEAGFSGLVTIDRIAYPSYDSLTALSAAAGATERISLMTNILLAPIYPPVLLGKTAASIDQLSGGRFTLGLAAGGRPDDYEVSRPRLPPQRSRFRSCARGHAPGVAWRGPCPRLLTSEPDANARRAGTHSVRRQ